MNSLRWKILLAGLAVSLALTPASWAKDDPLIFSVWADGSELVIEGTALAKDEVTEPSVTLNDQVLVVTSFTATEVRALLPDPPLGAGSYLLTVESKAGTGGVFDATLAVSDLICIGCVSEAELEFDPATQGELDTHAGSADAHREHATLEESLEIAADIAAHAGNASVHHAKVTLEDITPTTTRADLLVDDGANVVRLPVGTDGQVLMVDSSQPTGLRWTDLPFQSLRFVDLGDGTIRDMNTGKIWLKDASCSDLPGTDAEGRPVNWQDAKDAAAALESGLCGLTDGSVPGQWRLPEIGEFCSEDWPTPTLGLCPIASAVDSLVNRNFPYPGPMISNAKGDAVWTTDGDAFIGVQASYWSATQCGAGCVYVMRLTDGNVGDAGPTFYQPFVWPVRGGQ